MDVLPEVNVFDLFSSGRVFFKMFDGMLHLKMVVNLPFLNLYFV